MKVVMKEHDTLIVLIPYYFGFPISAEFLGVLVGGEM